MMSSQRIAAVVVADFYKDIADALLASCNEVLAAADVASEVITVPGALDIPAALERLVRGDAPHYLRYHCFVALGCVIRGETYHFEVVANTSAAGIVKVQLKHGVAVGNGILTVENMQQALARTDKGGAAAAAALALAEV